jgi:hypothetical protein
VAEKQTQEMTDFRLGKREFLNREGFHEDASLTYHFTVDDRGYFSGNISVRDCGEAIHLELNVHDDDWVENSEYKIETMIRLLQSAKRDMKKAQREMIKRKAAREKKNK